MHFERCEPDPQQIQLSTALLTSVERDQFMLAEDLILRSPHAKQKREALWREIRGKTSWSSAFLNQFCKTFWLNRHT